MSERPLRPRVLTGDRPTGPLHLGHLVGSLRSRVAMQDDHACYVLIADLHALSTRSDRERLDAMGAHVRAIVTDLLAAGIDPARTTVYLQSAVPAVYDLAVLLQMITPRRKLEELPSLAAMAEAARIAAGDVTLGLLGYPVLQAADILMARAEIVPVGADNVERVELARTLAATFNERYGDVFPLPAPHVGKVPVLPGVEIGPAGSRRKMSKSLGNTVWLSDPPETVADKLATLRRLEGVADEDQPVAVFARAFLPEDEADEAVRDWAADRLSTGAILERITRAVLDELEPIRARRAEIEAEPDLVDEVLVDGTIRARDVAYATLENVRRAMGFADFWDRAVEAAHARSKARKSPYGTP
ncbi:MAG: tryptophan--tRNA ligase [Deltaproteobacteria bacterium]|nr:MAG: tryptophan--tRNA ligase [Deltaproteobacteria bacterium]